MPIDPTTLSNADLRVELAKTRARLEFTGAIRREGDTERVVPTYTDTNTAALYIALSTEADTRGVDA